MCSADGGQALLLQTLLLTHTQSQAPPSPSPTRQRGTRRTLQFQGFNLLEPSGIFRQKNKKNRKIYNCTLSTHTLAHARTHTLTHIYVHIYIFVFYKNRSVCIHYATRQNDGTAALGVPAGTVRHTKAFRVLGGPRPSGRPSPSALLLVFYPLDLLTPGVSCAPGCRWSFLGAVFAPTSSLWNSPPNPSLLLPPHFNVIVHLRTEIKQDVSDRALER